MKHFFSMMMFAVLMMMGQTVKAITYYSLSIGDDAQVTSENANDILGDGKFSYNVNTNTLVVKDGAKVSSLRICIYNNIEGLTIQFCGSADLYTYGRNNSCISANKNTRIVATGPGTVNLKSDGMAAIYISNSTLTIEASQSNCNFYLNSSIGAGVYGNSEATFNLVGCPTLNITPSSYALTGLSSIDLGDCQVALPTHGTCKPAGIMESCVYDSFGEAQKKGNVVITHKDNITDYNLRVGGVYVTNWNEDKITGPTINGSVRYDWAIRMLSFYNATIDAQYNGDFYNGINCYDNYPYDYLQVRLTGKNEIIAQSMVASISSSKNLYFTGSGSLEANTGIWISGKGKTMEFNGRCNVKARGIYSDAKNAGNTLSVNTATLTTPTIYGFDELILTNADFYEPEGVRYDTELQNLVTADGEFWNAREDVVIKPYMEYGIKVGGVEVTEWNADDIKGDNILGGHISYNTRTNKLTLQDAVIDCADGIVGFESTQNDLTIQLVGSNSITNKTGSTMVFNSNANTITGDGTLDVGSPSIGRAIDVLDGKLSISGKCRVNATGYSFGVLGTTTSTLVVDEQARLTARATRTDDAVRKAAVAGFAGISLGVDTDVLLPVGGQIVNVTSSASSLMPEGWTIAEYYGPIVTEAVLGESYGISVMTDNGLKSGVVSELNADSITANGITGHMSYDAENHVLTLDNVTFGEGFGLDISHQLYTKWDTLHIVLKGRNKVNFIYQDKLFNAVKFSGGGSLNLLANLGFIMKTASLVVSDGCTVKAYGIEGGFKPVASKQTMTVDYANVQVNTTIGGFTDLILNGAEIMSPAGAYYDSNSGYVKKDGYVVTNGCTISEILCGIRVAGVEVTSRNASNITGERITGRVSYDSKNQVLTLDNATIGTGGIRVNKTSDADLGMLTIKLIGENSIEGNLIQSNLFNPLKICGDGTLDVPMIRLGHGSLVFDEGCKVNVSSTVRGSRFTDNGTYIYSVLKVYNSTLKVGTDIYGFSDLLMYGVEFTDPVGAYFLNESGKPTSMGYVYDKDGNRIMEGFTISPFIVSVEDITLLIDRYLEPGSTVQLIDITNLIDRYLEQ